MNECMGKQSCRLSTITLLGHIVRKQPPWIHKIARFPLLASLLKCLKVSKIQSQSSVIGLQMGLWTWIMTDLSKLRNGILYCFIWDIFELSSIHMYICMYIYVCVYVHLCKLLFKNVGSVFGYLNVYVSYDKKYIKTVILGDIITI